MRRQNILFILFLCTAFLAVGRLALASQDDTRLINQTKAAEQQKRPTVGYLIR